MINRSSERSLRQRRGETGVKKLLIKQVMFCRSEMTESIRLPECADGSDGRGDKLCRDAGTVVYMLEHLATFSVGGQSAIGDARDGLRRLLQMEKSSGIWTQKMQLQLMVANSTVVIVDHENGDIVEKFPAELIREPTAFTSEDPRELYNNIFIFIVGVSGASSSSELHIFQCLGISAQRLVEDMKAFISGRSLAPVSSFPSHQPTGQSAVQSDSVPRRHDSDSSSSPLPSEQRPHSITGRNHSHFEASRLGYRDRGNADSCVSGIDAETSSTASERYERDVAVLNHCFDDIEKFISRLQQAAVASRELEKRRKKRQANRKDFGEGMLSMRARAPPQSAFAEILQKFKLSFNLLAKLKAHIHDPNAPELVHFLFTPLALIVDAARECSSGAEAPGSDLPSSVLAPLLSSLAVDLLLNCLTSKESELWHSLGEAWCRPRDEWKGSLPVYQPVFYNGWSPKLPADDLWPLGAAPAGLTVDSRSGRGRSGGGGEQQAFVRHSDHFVTEPFIDGHSSYHGNQRYSPLHRRECTPSSSEEAREPGAVISGGGSAGGPIGVESSRSGSADSVVVGGGGSNGGGVERRQHRAWLDEATARGIPLVQVTYPRTANNDKELTVTRGEYLMVIDDSRKWWRVQNYLGQVGHVPHTIVSHVPPNEQENPVASSDWVKKHRQGKKGEFRYI